MDEKLFLRYVSKIQTAAEKFVNQELEDKVSLYEFMVTEILGEIQPHLNLEDSDFDDDFDELENDGEDDEFDEDFSLEYCSAFGSIDDFFANEHYFNLMGKLANNFSWVRPRLFKSESDEKAMEEIARTIFGHDIMDLDDEDISDDTRYAIQNNYNVLITFLKDQFKYTCLEYLNWRISEEKSTINSDNFVIHGQPRGNGELLFIISRTISEAMTDILNCNQPKNVVTHNDISHIRELQDEIADLKDENKELECELKDILERNQTLQRQLADFDQRKQKEFEQMKSDNEDIQLENNRLARRNAQLEEEIVRLKTQLTTQPTQIVVSEVKSEELSEVDVTKRYVFVMDGNPYGESQLLKAFPNSTIISDNVSLNANSIDAVICITRRVKHCIYEAIKGQCESKNIPFIHCMQNNVEMVKNAIRKADLK